MFIMPAKIGDTVSFDSYGRTFTVRRINRDTWNLSASDIKERSRFGNFSEISQDVDYAEQFGVLPRPSGTRW